MEFRDYARLLAKRWILILGILLLCSAAGAGAAYVTTPTYQANSVLFVSTKMGDETSQQLMQGGTFTADRVKSYAELATSPSVLDKVVADTGGIRSSEQIAREVSVRAPTDTVLLTIAVVDTDRAAAAAIANSVGTQLGSLISELEAPVPGAPSPVRATLVRPAVAPAMPVAPDLSVYLAVAILAGLVLGIGTAVLLDKMDTSIENPDDLKRLAVAGSLPVLATVARDTKRSSGPIVTGDRPGVRGEAYRQLRTNLQFASVDDPPRTIVITSAVAAEGKSSVAGNLATTLSEAGSSVCLVDGDLRRPSVADYMGLVGETGLTTVLIGRADLSAVLQKVGPKLTVLTSGVIPPNPSELLSSARMSAVLRELTERFDVVLIDAPPVLPVADAALLAGSADGVLYVVRAQKTSRNHVEAAVQNLDQVKARMLVLVLNMAPVRRGSTYYRYGYGSYTSATPASTGSAGPDLTDPVDTPVPAAADGVPAVGTPVPAVDNSATQPAPAVRRPTPHHRNGAFSTSGTGRSGRESGA